MFSDCWQGRLKTTLDRHYRVAVLGVGNELYADDAAGLLVARRLRQSCPCQSLLAVEAGSAPENVLGVLRGFQPQTVVIVDAAQMDLAPGAVGWLDFGDVDGLSASSHTLPLSALARYVSEEYGCEVVMLGIQPVVNTLLEPISAPVVQTIDQIVCIIKDAQLVRVSNDLWQAAK